MVIQTPVPGNLPTTYLDPLDEWLFRPPYQETYQQHTWTLLTLCHDLGWVVNMKKLELTAQQDFNFVSYRFDLLTGRVLPTQDRWLALQRKLQFIKNRDSCTVRQFSQTIHDRSAYSHRETSLVRSLHMRPIQWHLKRHWHVPESLEKVIPLPKALQPHLDCCLDERNVLRSQALHTPGHALQMFTDASNEGWGAHLGDSSARGMWSDTESHLHINF